MPSHDTHNGQLLSWSEWKLQRKVVSTLRPLHCSRGMKNLAFTSNSQIWDTRAVWCANSGFQGLHVIYFWIADISTWHSANIRFSGRIPVEGHLTLVVVGIHSPSKKKAMIRNENRILRGLMDYKWNSLLSIISKILVHYCKQIEHSKINIVLITELRCIYSSSSQRIIRVHYIAVVVYSISDNVHWS